MVEVAAAGRHLVSEEYSVVEWSVRVRESWGGPVTTFANVMAIPAHLNPDASR